MGMVRIPRKVKLVTGLLSNDNALFEIAKAALQRIFGKIDFESNELEFTNTDYYEKEMGPHLKRKFFSFEKLLDLKNIYTVKLRTNLLEKKFLRSGGCRAINIDPGYLDLSKLVLFSTKDYSHRIYLDKGIFAEVTLFYKDKCFKSWPWTYPDYTRKDYTDIFDHIRDIYRKQEIGK